MSSKICCLENVDSNTVMGYGEDELVIIDRRCESTVARMNDLPDSHINYVRTDSNNLFRSYVCRDSYLLLVDLRKPA